MNSDQTAQRSTQAVVQEQEIARLRDQLRDARQMARQAARVEVGRRYRAAIAGLTVGGLLIGGLIGHYGIPDRSPDDGSAPVVTGTTGAVAFAGHQPEVGALTTSVVGTPWPVRVYVSGAVTTPQVVEVPAGSLVADVIAAAGGAGVDADLGALNLAAPVADNQHLIVPHLATCAAISGDGADAETAMPIDINQASCDELTALPTIGEVKAAAIVAYRLEHGPFKEVAEIQQVSGIGPATFETIAPFITVTD